MRLTTNGIGIHKLSVTNNAVNVYGNDAFGAWADHLTLRLKRITTTPDGPVFVFARGDGVGTKPANSHRWWVRAWSKEQKKPPLAAFGATEPVLVRLTDAHELEIHMPPAVRCVKVLRPKGNHKKRAKEAAIEANRYVPPELPLEDPVTEVTSDPEVEDICKLIDSWGAKAPDYGPVPVPTDPVQHMRNAVATINAYKGVKGSAVVLTVTDSGRLRVFEAHD